MKVLRFEVKIERLGQKWKGKEEIACYKQGIQLATFIVSFKKITKYLTYTKNEHNLYVGYRRQ